LIPSAAISRTRTMNAARSKPVSRSRWKWASAKTWDEIAQRSPCTTPFHTRAWCETIAAYDKRFAAKALTLELTRGGELLVPLVVRSGALRRGPFSRAVSTQPGVYGGPIAATGALDLATWREFVAASKDIPLGRLDCFGNVHDPLPAELASELDATPRTTHVIELATLPENPRATYRKGAKHSLTKAERAGVVVAPARGDADIQAYFAVYRDSLRRWGKTEERSYRLELFCALARRPLAELWLARMPGGEVAAGGVFLFTQRHCVWWHGAMHADFADASPSNALIHHMLIEARSRGCELFDFNPSGGHGGVETFKQGFRPVAREFSIWTQRSPLAAKLVRSRARR